MTGVYGVAKLVIRLSECKKKSPMQDYRVQLEIYQGPLDLLLYLIRREEVDIYDIPISRVTKQFVDYVELLREIDPNAVGDFLVMAATLMEIKSRLLLPTPPAEEGDEDLGDPRLDLVRQLLQYKSFKDAAYRLGEIAEEHSMRFARTPSDAPKDEVEVELDEVQIWDLLTAFNNLMAAIGRPAAQHEVIYDDTPISLHAADIQDRLEREGGSIRFISIFEGRSKPEMIGLFLAMLELMRQGRVRAEQEKALGEIYLHLLDATPITEASLLDAVRPENREDAEPAEEEYEKEPEDGRKETVYAVAAEEEEEPESRDDEFARLLDQVNADVTVETDLPPNRSEEGEQGESEEEQP